MAIQAEVLYAEGDQVVWANPDLFYSYLNSHGEGPFKVERIYENGFARVSGGLKEQFTMRFSCFKKYEDGDPVSGIGNRGTSTQN